MSSGGGHNLMVGTHDRAVRPVLPCQPLDHLIGPLAPFRVNYLNSRTMLSLFNRLAMLPSVKHHCHGMAFPLSICREIPEKCFPGHLRLQTSASSDTGEKIVPIDDHVHRHEKPYPRLRRTVNERSSRT